MIVVSEVYEKCRFSTSILDKEERDMAFVA